MGKYVDSKRNEWETDRNFYGSSMKHEQIKTFIYERPESLEQNKQMKDWKGRKNNYLTRSKASRRYCIILKSRIEYICRQECAVYSRELN